jgi:hypothetical protein
MVYRHSEVWPTREAVLRGHDAPITVAEVDAHMQTWAADGWELVSANTVLVTFNPTKPPMPMHSFFWRK